MTPERVAPPTPTRRESEHLDALVDAHSSSPSGTQSDFAWQCSSPRSGGVYCLPPEAISRVFEFCVPETSFWRYFDETIGRQLSPVVITHVSNRFRKIAINTPRLWNRISINYPYSMVKAYLERSKQVPLSITGAVDVAVDAEALTRLFHVLCEHINRWHTVDLERTPSAAFIFGRYPNYTELPMLSELRLQNKPHSGSQSIVVPLPTWSMPVIQKIEMDNIIPTRSFGQALKSCTLAYRSHQFSTSTLDILEVLQNSPLTTLNLTLRVSETFTPNIDIKRPPTRIFNFTSLLSLTLEIAGSDRHGDCNLFLPSMMMPNLENFKFTYDTIPWLPELLAETALHFSRFGSPLLRVEEFLFDCSYMRNERADVDILAEFVKNMPNLQYMSVAGSSIPYGYDFQTKAVDDYPWRHFPPVKEFSYSQTDHIMIDASYADRFLDILDAKFNGSRPSVDFWEIEGIDPATLERLNERGRRIRDDSEPPEL